MLRSRQICSGEKIVVSVNRTAMYAAGNAFLQHAILQTGFGLDTPTGANQTAVDGRHHIAPTPCNEHLPPTSPQHITPGYGTQHKARIPLCARREEQNCSNPSPDSARAKVNINHHHHYRHHRRHCNNRSGGTSSNSCTKHQTPRRPPTPPSTGPCASPCPSHYLGYHHHCGPCHRRQQQGAHSVGGAQHPPPPPPPHPPPPPPPPHPPPPPPPHAPKDAPPPPPALHQPISLHSCDGGYI